jgi:hypothetical protein
LPGYYTDSREYSQKFAFTSNIYGFIHTDYSSYTRHERVDSFRSGRGESGKEITSSRDLIASATDGQKSRFNKFDTGHSFLSRKELPIKHSFPGVFLTSPVDSTKFFRGPLEVPLDTDTTSGAVWPLVSTINTGYYAPRFVAQTNPTTPIAGIGQFLGEIERLPKFFLNESYLRYRVNYFRLLGNDYLNVAFGWLPFISDLKKAVDVAIHANDLARQIYQDSGRWIRRKRTLDPIVNTVLKRYKTANPYRLNFLDSNQAAVFFVGGNQYGDLTVEDTITETYSFSAAFQYFIEGDGTFLGEADSQLKALDRLLGFKPTPSVLYELMPYSWLIDWMSNVGNVVSNWTQFMDDRLVMPYCYLMRTTHVKRVATARDVRLYSYPNPISPTTTQETVQKERVRGTPFGFGLDPDGFTGRQWAILAALGLSKGPRSLP